MSFDQIKQAAAADGYELAYQEESWGDSFFGVAILVKMSDRKIHSDKDSLTFIRAARAIRNGLNTVTAELDPARDANREACRADIANIYKAAGVEAIYMEPLPNGYCSKPCCLNKPWFRVTSRIGHVVIGWRKSVISIDWKDSTVKATGLTLFPTEDVTRSETGIHAHGRDAAAKYIRQLHEVTP